ncbi:hypothetical protein D3C86_1405800 [compost metagenome]
MIGLRSSRHADRGDVDQHLRATTPQLCLPLIPQRLRQRLPGALVAGYDQAVFIAAIAQGARHGLGHAAAAAQGKGRVLGHLVFFQQLGHGDVIGVVGLEMSVGVDDGVDRLNGGGRRVELIHQGNAGFLERHRHATTTNPQGANTGNGTRQVLAGKGLVVKVQAQLFIQMIVKTQTKVPGAS